MTTALRDIGYTEDRSAALDFTSQGSYKQQHDTGQNLKTIIVFPNVACSSKSNENDDNVKSESNEIDTNSKSYIFTISEFSTFCEMIQAKTQSWKQRKCVLKELQIIQETYQQIEQKLFKGEILSNIENKLYEIYNQNITEKMNWLQNIIKKMIDDGKLTVEEKQELVQSVEQNIQHVLTEISAIAGNADANAGNKSEQMKLNKLNEKLSNVQARLATVKNVSPISPYRVHNYADVHILYLKLFKLQKLDEKSGNNQLTLADLKKLEEMPVLEQQIHAMNMQSKQWYEDDITFDKKVKHEYDEAMKQFQHLQASKKDKSGGKGGNSGGTGTKGKIFVSNAHPSSSSNGNAWSTIGTKKNGSSTRAVSASAKNHSGGFAAAFGEDSDSS